MSNRILFIKDYPGLSRWTINVSAAEPKCGLLAALHFPLCEMLVSLTFLSLSLLICMMGMSIPKSQDQGRNVM